MADEASSFLYQTKPSSSLISSFFTGYFSKKLLDSETLTFSLANTKENARGIGLAMIVSIIEGPDEKTFPKQVNRMELNGSKLQLQIPETFTSPVNSPMDSPAEFGIKTKKSQFTTTQLPVSRDLIRQLSLEEMELSEDYTCVVTHGPNPITTHIFDEYIVESCGGDHRRNYSVSGAGNRACA